MFLRVVTIVLLFHLAQGKRTGPRQVQKHHKSSRTFNDIDAHRTTQCGGVFKTEYGAIDYKPYDIVKANERCVWTISAPNATSYGVYTEGLEHLSFLTITTLELDNLNANHTRPENGSGFWEFDNVNVLLVTFHPGNISTRGFYLDYNGYNVNGGIVANSSSEHVIAPATVGRLRYPKERVGHGQFELSTFVITPITACNGSFRKTEIVYAATGGHYSFFNLFVYGLQTSQSGLHEWKFLGGLYGEYGMQKISNKDLILIVFMSYDTEGTSGFQIYADTNEC